ncbi:uncharacterized protein BROUX77_002264 [Berkeleyomyces rouxiae]|uniref:uncharacterized protein n=1 Tax=Berkeleyomyces rouxiae TaxID=2035830 RepID=UPI003B805BEE
MLVVESVPPYRLSSLFIFQEELESPRADRKECLAQSARAYRMEHAFRICSLIATGQIPQAVRHSVDARGHVRDVLVEEKFGV